MRHAFLTTSALVGLLLVSACGDTGQSQSESSTQSEDVKATARRQQHRPGPSKDGGSSERDSAATRDGGGSVRDSAAARDGSSSQRGSTGSRDGGLG